MRKEKGRKRETEGGRKGRRERESEEGEREEKRDRGGEKGESKNENRSKTKCRDRKTTPKLDLRCLRGRSVMDPSSDSRCGRCGMCWSVCV